MPAHPYNADIIAWANEQAHFLRSGRFECLDITHLAEEIEDVGKSEQRELAHRLVVLLTHLLKWQYQPERRGASWECTIREQRRAVQRRLNKTPSLVSYLADADWLEDIWLDTRTETAKETGIGFDQFPTRCPWSITDLLNAEWWPE